MLKNTRFVLKILKRKCHIKNVRVRFAPSPTGYLHLGGLRTALYNYLFAKKNNGQFILRIEDTDQNRLVKGATERLVDDLKWCGLQIDEGPFFGGQFGPYIQSERIKIYSKEVNKLLEGGHAYYCFCTQKRLELLRRDAVRNRQVSKYDNKCRQLTPVEVSEKLSKNIQFCIRFKLESFIKTFFDLVYGEISYNAAENEGDPIIIKSDGFPTYHFANVVDDHYMKISHVFRGVEWQISTVKHLLLYDAFGWKPPIFGHLPLLINSNGTKLSKRQGDIQINQYRENGIFPTALVNYLSIAGGGFSRVQGIAPRIFSLDELTQQFNIDKVNSHPSKLNPDLLKIFNRYEIIRLMKNEKTKIVLVFELKKIIVEKYSKNKSIDLDFSQIEKILNWCCNRISSIHDLTNEEYAFLWVKPTKQLGEEIYSDILQNLISKLETNPFERHSIYSMLKSFSKENNINFACLMRMLRSKITGYNNGPGVSEMLEILGKEASIQRLISPINVKNKNNEIK